MGIGKYVCLIESHEEPKIDSSKEMLATSQLPSPVVDAGGMGGIPMNTNIDHLGLRVSMTPMKFLQLAERLTLDMDSQYFLKLRKKLRTGTPMAQPYLELREEGGTFVVVHHNGRHRMHAIQSIRRWKNEPIEVHIVIQGYRHHAITDNMRRRIMESIKSEDRSNDVFHPIEEFLS